jgi:hypothetical protein
MDRRPASMASPSLSQMREIERTNVPGVRQALGALGAVVAEVDRELRYLWIDNPHPDFDARSVVGKRDEELIGAAEAQQLMSVKRETFERQVPVARVLSFKRSDGLRNYSLFAYPIREDGGDVRGILTVAFDTPAPERTAGSE